MSCIILDGKKVAQEIKNSIKESIENKLNSHTNIRTPRLTIYTDGLDEASKIYLKNKKKACEEVGIQCNIVTIDPNIPNFHIDYETDGAILQLPVKNKEQELSFLDRITTAMDVDGLTSVNQGNLFLGIDPKYEFYQTPCTPKGIMRLLDHYNIDLEGKNVLVIGRSKLVGKPIATLMLDRNATVTVAHSKTDPQDLSFKLSEADVVVSAVGIANFIHPDELKKGCILIDVGISRDSFTGKICGDVANPNNELDVVCSYRTPVPGGVGPMTVAMLLENVYYAWEYHRYFDEN